MKTVLTALCVLALAGCSAIATVPASNCGWVTTDDGVRTWTCSVTTVPTTEPAPVPVPTPVPVPVRE